MKKAILRAALALIDNNAIASNYGAEYRTNFISVYRESDKTLESVKEILMDFGFSCETIDLDEYFN